MEPIEYINLLEQKLAELKVIYDKYFAGVEKREPMKERTDVQRLVRQLGSLHLTNTALKFKKNSLISQFNTYSRYWDRILKQIEDGTYSRDLFKMDLKYGKTTTAPTTSPGSSPPPSTPPPKMKGTSSPSSPSTPPPKKGKEFEDVYRALVTTKMKLGETTQNLNYNALSANLKKQSDVIKKKYSVSRVDFMVEEKNGKAVIKAVPKKGK